MLSECAVLCMAVVHSDNAPVSSSKLSVYLGLGLVFVWV